MILKPDNNLFDKIISACKQEKELRKKKKLQLVAVLASALLIALLVLSFSMGMLIGQTSSGGW